MAIVSKGLAPILEAVKRGITIKKLGNIQGLRFLAASAVVVDHSLGVAPNQSPQFQSLHWHLGLMGVWTFFVISGFIMVHAEGQNFGSVNGAAAFGRKRIVRIVPMYWLATAVALAAHISTLSDIGTILASLFFVPVAVPAGHAMRPVLGQGWTLNYEMFFYVAFAIAMLPGVGMRKLLAAFGVLALIGVVLGGLFVPYDANTVAQFLTDPIILLFCTGMLLRTYLDKIPEIPLPPMFLVVVLVILNLWLFAAAGFTYPLSTAQRVIFWPSAIALVVLCASSKPIPGKIGKAVTKLGDASYCTYLFHVFVVHGTARLLQPDNVYLFSVAMVVVANLVGLAIHSLVEKPLTTLARNVSSGFEILSPRSHQPRTRQ